MNSHLIPLEIVEHITTYLSINDRLSCLLTCKAWHAYLYQSIIRNVTIHARRELKSFLSYLDKYKDIGNDVREIYFKLRVGLTPSEFSFICRQCPLLEVYKFTTWNNYKKDSFCSLSHLKQIPKLYDQEKAYNAIATCGHTLTHLELSELLLRKLIPRRDHLTLLQFTTQLTHLRLDGVFSLDPDEIDARRMEFDYNDWNFIHRHCIHLKHLSMSRVHLVASPLEATYMQSVTHVAPNMKHLVLGSLYLNNPVWIHYLAFMYPNLIELELDFGIGCFIHLAGDEADSRLDTIECHTGFLILAHELKNLKSLRLRGLRQTHFPGTFFFKMLTNRGVQLENICIKYDTSDFTPCGMNIVAYDSLIHGQHRTIKTLELDMWNGIYEEVSRFLIEPLTLCTQLTKLSLWNDDFRNYYYDAIPLDLILKTCSKLEEISFVRIALCIEKNRNTATHKYQHPLMRLSLTSSRISQPIFDYLSLHCTKMNYLSLLSCSWMPREIEMKIDMPNNTFEHIRIADLNRRKTTALEGNLVQGHTVNIFTITQLDKIKRKKERYKKRNISIDDNLLILSNWYHLFEPPPTRRFYIPSVIRRLKQREVMVCYYLTEYFKDNQHLSKARNFQELETRYLGKKYWRSDVASGFIHITCKSLKSVKYNFNMIHYRIFL